MHISIFGLGYVGVASAACLAKTGHSVLGVDIAREKVALIENGISPIREPGLGDLVRQQVAEGRLSATADVQRAVAETELAMVCVGTPSSEDGSPDTTQVRRVAEALGDQLATRSEPFRVVLRSTMLPGTTEGIVFPILEMATGRPNGQGYDVIYHPEFLREGSSIDDFFRPPRIVVGAETRNAANTVLDLYEGIDAPRVSTSIRLAEAVKYADNAFHALKVVFANEVGSWCRQNKINGLELMDVFRLDGKLNLSGRYLTPGPPFGGSCLPKDLRAVVASAIELDTPLPLMEAILKSNEIHMGRLFDMVAGTHPNHVGLYGVAFKPGTDDLRESPYLELVRRMDAAGWRVTVYDPVVEPQSLLGENRRVVESIEHAKWSMFTRSVDALREADTVVVAHDVNRRLLNDWLAAGASVVDLAGSGRGIVHPRYHGIGWCVGSGESEPRIPEIQITC